MGRVPGKHCTITTHAAMWKEVSGNLWNTSLSHGRIGIYKQGKRDIFCAPPIAPPPTSPHTHKCTHLQQSVKAHYVPSTLTLQIM